MDLIIGGAYQGKLDYARERFHLETEDLSFYENGYDTTRRCLCYLEQAVYDAVAAGRPFELPPLRADAVVICTDVSCGVAYGQGAAPVAGGGGPHRVRPGPPGRQRNTGVLRTAAKTEVNKVKTPRPEIPAVAFFC